MEIKRERERERERKAQETHITHIYDISEFWKREKMTTSEHLAKQILYFVCMCWKNMNTFKVINVLHLLNAIKYITNW
jgi:hypothetical protein